MDYATSSDVATFIGQSLSASFSGNVALALTAASRAVDAFCNRDFETGINTASTMTVEVRSLWRAETPRDFHTTDDLVVALDNDGDGTAETTIAASGYQLYPLNQYLPGVGTVSYSEIRLTDTYMYQCSQVRPVLHVTAKWGWAAIPDPVKRATVMLTAEMLKDPEIPFGMIPFATEQTAGAIRLRANPRIALALQPYVRSSSAVMVA